jgi:hypothetical protein
MPEPILGRQPGRVKVAPPMPVEPARASHMHLRLRWCCGCACLWAGATLPNKSSSVHLGSPADIFFALLRASRLALGAVFLLRGKRFRRWRGHSIQASQTTLAAAFPSRIPTKVQCRCRRPSIRRTRPDKLAPALPTDTPSSFRQSASRPSVRPFFRGDSRRGNRR